MKYLSVLLFCVSIYDRTYSCPRHTLKSKENELKISEHNNSPHSSVIGYLKKLQDEIALLKIKCHNFKGVSIQCWDSSYICRSTEYIAGCPCWTFEMKYENATMARLKFNKFYPNGVNDTKFDYQFEDSERRQDNILEVCDYVSPPWPFYYIYDGNAGLTEFTHCIQNWKIDCFCSSAQRTNHPKSIFQSGKRSDKTVRGPYKHHLDLCGDKIKYSCSDVKGKLDECSCWNYNTTYAKDEVKNILSSTNSARNSYLTRNLSKINVVICTHPYLHCSDESLVQGCPCWENEIEKKDAHSITYSGYKTTRLEAINRKEDVKRLDLSFQRVCKQKDFLEAFPTLGAHFHIATFTHCNNNGVIKCYCLSSAVAPILQTVNCPPPLVAINSNCAMPITD